MNGNRLKGMLLAAVLLLPSVSSAQTENLNIHARCSADVRALFLKGGNEAAFENALKEMHRCLRPCATEGDVAFLMSCENTSAAVDLAEKIRAEQKKMLTPTMDESLLANAFAGCSPEKLEEGRSRGLLNSTYFDPTGKYQRFLPFESVEAARAFTDPGRCVNATDTSTTLPIKPIALKVPPAPAVAAKAPEKNEEPSSIGLVAKGGTSYDWGTVEANGQPLGKSNAMSLHGSVSVHLPLATFDKPDPGAIKSDSLAIVIDPALRVALSTPGEKTRKEVDIYLEQLNSPERSESNVERATIRAGRLSLLMEKRNGKDGRTNKADIELLPIDLFNYEWDRMLGTESIGARVAAGRVDMDGQLVLDGALRMGITAELGAKIGENRIHDTTTPFLGYLVFNPSIGIDTGFGDIVAYGGIDIAGPISGEGRGDAFYTVKKGLALRNIGNTPYGISLGYEWGEMVSDTDSKGSVDYDYHMFTLDIAPSAIAF